MDGIYSYIRIGVFPAGQVPDAQRLESNTLPPMQRVQCAMDPDPQFRQGLEQGWRTPKTSTFPFGHAAGQLLMFLGLPPVQLRQCEVEALPQVAQKAVQIWQTFRMSTFPAGQVARAQEVTSSTYPPIQFVQVVVFEIPEQ